MHLNPPAPEVWAIFDLDGTLFDTRHREHLAREKRWDEFNAKCVEDPPRVAEVLLARAWHAAHLRHKIAICTGRSDAWRDETVRKLKQHGIPFDELHMRRSDDFRHDYDVKREMCDDGRIIAFVVEDRDQVVRMWREERGLTVFQCQPGAY